MISKKNCVDLHSSSFVFLCKMHKRKKGDLWNLRIDNELQYMIK